jgi:hypothetical protein
VEAAAESVEISTVLWIKMLTFWIFTGKNEAPRPPDWRFIYLQPNIAPELRLSLHHQFVLAKKENLCSESKPFWYVPL